MSHMTTGNVPMTMEDWAKLKSLIQPQDPRAAHVRAQVRAWTEVQKLNPEDRTVLRKLEFWEREHMGYSLE